MIGPGRKYTPLHKIKINIKKLLIISTSVIFLFVAINITYSSIPKDLKIDFVDVRSAETAL